MDGTPPTVTWTMDPGPVVTMSHDWHRQSLHEKRPLGVIRRVERLGQTRTTRQSRRVKGGATGNLS